MKRKNLIVAFLCLCTPGLTQKAFSTIISGNIEVKGGGIELSQGRAFKVGSFIRGGFGHSVLKDVMLTELDLSTVCFEDADIRGADFSWSNLKDVRFARALLAGAHFENSFGLTDEQKAKLKERGAFVSEKDPISKPGALITALRKADVAWAQQLIAHNFELEKPNESGETPLIMAAMSNLVPVVKSLLSKGVNLDAVSETNFTALIAACQNGNLEIVTMLLLAGADLNKPNTAGTTPMEVAFGYGYVDIAQLLLDEDQEFPTYSDQFKLVLLGLALRPTEPDLLELLIDRGFSVDMSDVKGNTALIAAAKGRKEIVQFLLKRGADVNKRTIALGVTALINAIDENNVEIAEMLLEKGADAAIATKSGITSLMLAVDRSQLKLSQELIARGVSIDAQASTEHTALSLAILNNNVDIVRLLLEKGAKLTYTVEGRNPLMHASVLGHADIVELFIAQAININAKDAAGDTALILAVEAGHKHVAKILIDAGANVSLKGQHGKTAHSLALEKEDFDTAHLIQASKSFKSPKASSKKTSPRKEKAT